MARLASVVFLAYVHSLNGLPYDNEYGPDYGNEWAMYLDDSGTTHMMNFSSLPTEQRGLILGEAYFHLYTRRNSIAEELHIPDDDYSAIHSQYYNSCNDVKIITHGWLSGEDAIWLQQIKNSFLKKSNLNVICVDWSELSKNVIYPWSALSTRYVGKRIAKLLAALKKTYGLDGKNVHLIGHSLGAQVMGYAGMYYDSQVARITGLDPARPLFEMPRMENEFRLEKSDADFVDIIHSCGGVLGYFNSQGHADFFPNDGRARQPGCEGLQQIIESCSHGRSHEYFEESISSQVLQFVAYPCESWDKFNNGECRENATLMGYPASPDRQGNFYLHTRSDYQYAVGEDN